MKVGVLVFPGSNCDRDTEWVFRDLLNVECQMIWHKEILTENYDLIVLPGGFSYGDYLRTGAIACISPVIDGLRKHAQKGGLIMGICNGFQILCEAGLLPGTLMINSGLKFICEDVFLKTERHDSAFSCSIKNGDTLKMPIAHHSGRYHVDQQTFDLLEKQNRILFRYCNQDGQCVPEANPNGSIGEIAAVLSEKGNILGMMPHPERAAHRSIGSEDGMLVFNSIVDWLKTR
jgi:phosphoribosylformylglycinamidine synthase subunit PurQ / glutaminase